jgi:hypothetical protein
MLGEDDRVCAGVHRKEAIVYKCFMSWRFAFPFERGWGGGCLVCDGVGWTGV